MKYSYNGKKWYTYPKGSFEANSFAIKGKQSVYLHFKEYIRFGQTASNIKVSNYQYVQMCCWPVEYNLQFQGSLLPPQIRFNLSSGTAAVGDFTATNGHGQVAFVWDGDIFPREYGDL